MSDEQRPAAGFTPFDAAVWTAGATFAFILVVSLTQDLENPDRVALFTVQVVVYLSLCALFAWRRPGRSFSELFALRRTSTWLLALGLLLGPALFGPAETLGRIVEKLAPPSPAELEAMRLLLPGDRLQGVLMFVLAALAGPFVEELLYRGAIYTGLRPRYSMSVAIWTSALCFTLSHQNSRAWPAILVLALVLSTLRARSGSLWPVFLAHAGFNASQLGVFWAARGDSIEVPLVYEIGGWVLSAALLVAALLVGQRSSAAQEARRMDDTAAPSPEPEA